MRKQVLTYLTLARELRAGDRILTARMVVAEVESVELFEDTTKRPCVAIVARGGQQIVCATNFLSDEAILIIE